MEWLRKVIKEHNERLTYTDYEESWTVSGWMCSLVALTLVSVIPLVVISFQEQKPLIAVSGLCLGAFVVWWHFWHIMHW